jgi:hypothetical protein
MELPLGDVLSAIADKILGRELFYLNYWSNEYCYKKRHLCNYFSYTSKNRVSGSENPPIKKAKLSSKMGGPILFYETRASNFVPRFFPLTTQVDFVSIARLNLTLIQFDKVSITSRQWENLPR